MNNLQKTLARLIVLSRSMTPQARMVAALVLVVIVISAAYLLNVGVSGDRVYLFGDSPVAVGQLNSMRAAFAKAGLNDAEFEGDRIRVPRAQQAQYLSALADAEALPHNFGDTLRKMLMTSSPFISKKKQEEMMKFGMQKELSEVVGKLRGMEWATVMYYDQPAAWPNQKRDVRACVTVKLKGNGSLTAELARKIRDVVATPIGATPQEVTVVDSQGQGASYSTATYENTGTLGHDLYAAKQCEYEKTYKEKIQAALSFVPSAVVTVNVELHSEVEDSAQSVKIDTKLPSDDRPGEGDHPHAPAALKNVRKFDLGSANSPASIDLTGADGYETRNVKRAGLTPKRVTVSVAVPRSYFEQQWQLRHGRDASAKPNASELVKIEDEIRSDLKQHVLQVLPTPEDDRTQLNSSVTVTAFSTAPPPDIVQLTQSEQVFVWLNEHSGLVVAVVSCFLGLLMLRSIVRSAARSASQETQSQQHDEIDEPHELPRPPAYSRSRRRRSMQGTAMRDELSEIVRDDPNAAANVLRSWIGSTN